MKQLLCLAIVVLTAGCAGHSARPLVVVVPAVPIVESHIWLVPLSTPSDDRICVQTIEHGYRPCWTVGQLRMALVSLKAE